MKALLVVTLCVGEAIAGAARAPTVPTPKTIEQREQNIARHICKALPVYGDAIVSDARLKINRSIVHGRGGSKTAKPDYDYVFSQEANTRAQDFFERYDSFFLLEKERYGVPKELIGGILNIETQWGKGFGKYPVIISLYTIAVLRPNFQKPAWAENELIAFLKICKRNRWDPFSIRGSPTGAFGFAQFEPTSYLQFARRCESDGRAPDLFNAPDAICSIGYYVKSAGWSTSEASHRGALYAYNHDPVYANAVLDYADLAAHRNLTHPRYQFTNPHRNIVVRAALK